MARQGRRTASQGRGKGKGSGRGGGGEAGQGAGPERLRDSAVKQAIKQRRRLAEAKQREELKRDKAREASGKPKHGEEDDEDLSSPTPPHPEITE